MTRTPGKRETRKAREWWICFPSGPNLNPVTRVYRITKRWPVPPGHEGKEHRMVKVREVVKK